MLRLLRRSLLLAVVVLTAGLKLPAPGAAGAVGRRAAICLLPACLLAPQLAEAKYRPSLSEMKGYGSSPVVDKMNEEKQVATTLSFAQLVANSKSSQEKMMGRSLSDEEMTELQAHLAPKPATAITAATAAAAAAAAVLTPRHVLCAGEDPQILPERKVTSERPVLSCSGWLKNVWIRTRGSPFGSLKWRIRQSRCMLSSWIWSPSPVNTIDSRKKPSLALTVGRRLDLSRRARARVSSARARRARRAGRRYPLHRDVYTYLRPAIA